MSHGVHAVQHEVDHRIEHEGAHGDAAILQQSLNKRIALLIGVLALCLALAETMAKSAQTSALSYNIESANLWSFFQAKNIRRTTMLTAADDLSLRAKVASDPAMRGEMTKLVEKWRSTAARYQSEPSNGEGTKELAARAKKAHKKYDTAMARYHHYEVASAAFQIAIVLASATVITGLLALTWVAIGLGGLGLIFTLIGLFAPHAVHLF